MKKPIFLSLLLAAIMPAFLLDASSATLDFSPWISSPKNSTSSPYQTYHESDHQHRRTSNGFNSMDIKYDGKIRVSDDDRSIKSISPGGYLKISYRTFGNNRELVVNSDRSGNLSYEFYEGRKEIPYEPEGRSWLEDVLVDVVRSSGLDAEGRTKRIYSMRGIDGFIEEISRIHSTTGQARYFSALLSNQKLSPQELAKTADAISMKMSSNTERGRLFRQYAELFLEDNDVAVAYFNAVSRISSTTERGRVYRNIYRPLDFKDEFLVKAYFNGIDKLSSSTEKGSVLRHSINNQDLTMGAQIGLLESVAKMSSNTEAARVLRTITEIDLNDPGLNGAYFRAVDHLSSNTEKGRVLRDLLGKNVVEGPAMIAFLNSCRKISSNTEASSTLRTIKTINLADTRISDTYFSVIQSMSSDTETSRVLRYTLEVHQLNNPALIRFYETTRSVSSDTETSSVLRASIPYLPSEMAVQDAFFATVNSLSSSTEHGRVLRQYAASLDLSDHAVEGILNSARKISSNTEKGSVLRSIAPRVKAGNNQLRDLYMETAKSLSSDTEFRRAMDAIM